MKSRAGGLARPPSGMRTAMRTAAGGTAAGMRANFTASSIALNQTRNVEERPVTKQGVAIPNRIKTGYQNRNVRDSGYWKYSLQQRTNEIQSLIAEWQKETDDIYSELESYGPAVEQAEVLAKQLGELQAQFRAINLYKELRQKNELSESIIHQEFIAIQDENNYKKRAIEDLMSKKDAVEKQTKKVAADIETEENSRQSVLKSTLPRQEYVQVMEKQQQLKVLGDEMPVISERLGFLRQEVDSKVRSLQKDNPEKHLAFTLLMRIQNLIKEKSRLEEKNTKFDQEAEYERLMEEVKTKKQRIEEMRGQLGVLQTENKNLDDALSSYENDPHLQPEQMEKLRRLNAKQIEIKNFKENFPTYKEEELSKISMLQDDNDKLLSEISSKLEISKTLPSADKFGELKQTLDFKKNEMEKAESTQVAISAGKSKLISDLQKISQLKPKIEKEISDSKESIQKMTSELSQFSDVDGLKSREKEIKESLDTERQQLTTRMSWIKKEVQLMDSEREKLNAALKANETHNVLKGLEGKWIGEEQRNFGLSEYIREKASKTDFAKTKEDTLKSVKELNNIIIQNLK